MKKMIVVLILSALSAFAISLDTMQSVIQSNIDKSRALLVKHSEDKNKAANEMFKLFDPIFDYALMAKLSLSKNYDTLNAEQKKDFDKAFEMQLKATFTNHLSVYKNEDIKVTSKERVKERIFLNASMLINGEERKIIFKFYDKKGDWLVYDVDVAGVSIIQTYRSQFADLLEKENFSVLLEKLKAKNFEIKK